MAMKRARPIVGWVLAAWAAVGAWPASAPAAPSLEWADLYDGGGAYIDYVTALATDDNGHPVIAGESADGIGGVDLLVRKLDRSSQIPLWEQRIPAFDGNDMALTGMVRDGAGNFLIGGYIRGCVG